MAIDDLLDEHEQSERVRGWLRQNGAGLIGGVASGLGLIGGWQWWQQHQAAQQGRSRPPVHRHRAGRRCEDLKKATADNAALGEERHRSRGARRDARGAGPARRRRRDAAIATLRGVHAKDPAIASRRALAPCAPADRRRQAAGRAHAARRQARGRRGDRSPRRCAVRARPHRRCARGVRAGPRQARRRDAAAPPRRTQAHPGRRQPGPSGEPQSDEVQLQNVAARRARARRASFALGGCTTDQGLVRRQGRQARRRSRPN